MVILSVICIVFHHGLNAVSCVEEVSRIPLKETCSERNMEVSIADLYPGCLWF